MLLLVTLFLLPLLAHGGGGAPDLYSLLHDYDAKGNPPVAASPDPLVTYTFDTDAAGEDLQVFYRYPSRYEQETGSVGAFSNLESLNSTSPHVKVMGPGSIRFDFGSENAAWLEFDSPDLNLSASEVLLSISEYTLPAVVNAGPKHPNKTAVPMLHESNGTRTFRLELNDLLYEGVRFGWIHVITSHKEWTINEVRLVCQTKAVGSTQGCFIRVTLSSTKFGGLQRTL